MKMILLSNENYVALGPVLQAFDGNVCDISSDGTLSKPKWDVTLRKDEDRPWLSHIMVTDRESQRKPGRMTYNRKHIGTTEQLVVEGLVGAYMEALGEVQMLRDLMERVANSGELDSQPLAGS